MDRTQEWVALVGRRNIACVVFVSLLVPFGMLMEAAGSQVPDAGGGIMAAIILWSAVSLIFFMNDAGLAIGSLVRGQPSTKALIACTQPILCIVSHPDFVALLRTVMGFSLEVWMHIKRCKF
jgi:hypothetical protein